MNSIDLFIIYFAGGAPFAVYYFLQNRSENGDVGFWMRNSLVFLLWMPFAASLLLQNKRYRNVFNPRFFSFIFVNKSVMGEVLPLRKQIESLLPENSLNFSIFDFRETVERYAGLSLAVQNDIHGDSEREIFRAAKNENVKIGAVCLHRRNRNKLFRHQKEARRDYLEIVEQLSDLVTDRKFLQYSTTEIAKTLNDDAARECLEGMFAKNLQTGKPLSVSYSEKDLWKPQERKPLRAETITTR